MENVFWKEIWESRKDKLDDIDKKDKKAVFLELKRIDGFDVLGDGLSYEALEMQYQETKEALCLRKGDSVFEVGCGCGANLYLFSEDGIKVGGLDYSETLVRIMKKVFIGTPPLECICNSADKLPTNIKYDAVFSNSVFSYFPDYSYAENVLERMLVKANSCIGILDVHDENKKEAFLSYRKANVPDYEDRYKNLPKLFYHKDFFSDFAAKHHLRIDFRESKMQGYWNNEFVFHCFMYKANGFH